MKSRKVYWKPVPGQAAARMRDELGWDVRVKVRREEGELEGVIGEMVVGVFTGLLCLTAFLNCFFVFFVQFGRADVCVGERIHRHRTMCRDG